MSHIVALAALEDALSATLRSFMPDSVALETELLVALERVMPVFPAQDAVQTRRLEVVGTLTGHMPELLAIAALHGRVVEVLEEVARGLLLHL